MFYCAQGADINIQNQGTFIDTNLVMTLTAGTWGFRSVLFTTSNSNGGMETKLDYTGTVTSVGHSRMRFRTGTGFAQSIGNTSLPLTIIETASDDEWHHIVGGMVVSTGGDFKISIRQTTAVANFSRFRAGSYLRAVQL